MSEPVLYDSRGHRICKPKRVYGYVVDCQYVQKERSLMVILKETTSGKTSKPIQISASAFSFGASDEAMRAFAEKLKQRTQPLILEFNPGDSTGEIEGYIA